MVSGAEQSLTPTHPRPSHALPLLAELHSSPAHWPQPGTPGKEEFMDPRGVFSSLLNPGGECRVPEHRQGSQVLEHRAACRQRCETRFWRKIYFQVVKEGRTRDSEPDRGSQNLPEALSVPRSRRVAMLPSLASRFRQRPPLSTPGSQEGPTDTSDQVSAKHGGYRGLC